VVTGGGLSRRRALLGAAALTVTRRARATDEHPYRSETLRDHDGAKTSLARAAGGQRLVVVVIKGTWCPVCIGQLRSLGRRREELARLGTRVVGLSPDPHEKNKRTAEAHALAWPILADPRHRVIEALGLWREAWGHPLPAMLLFDRCGAERGRVEGRAPRDRAEETILRVLRALAQHPERCGVA
jgi:peroxiredoxin Q/BCP